MARKKENNLPAVQEEVPFQILDPDRADAYMRMTIQKHKEATRTQGAQRNLRKWTQDELDVRNQVIWDYISQGLSPVKVKENIAHRWGITMVTAGEYFKAAVEDLSKHTDEAREHYFNIQVARLEGIVQEAMDHHQYKEAAMATEQLSKLYGLYQPQTQINITTEFNFQT